LGVERAIERLNPRLAQEVGFIAEYVLAVHAGPATIGHVGHGSNRIQTAVGETVLGAAVLRDHAAARGIRFAISRQAATLSGLVDRADAWQAIGVPHTRIPLEFIEHRRAAELPVRA
jgi:adenylate cyclase